MRITIQALTEDVSGQTPHTETIGTMEREAERAPALGLGRFVGETHAILRRLQAVVLREEVAQFIDRAGSLWSSSPPPARTLLNGSMYLTNAS